MPQPVIASQIVVEDGVAWWLIRLIAVDGNPAQQTDITALSVKVFDESDDTETYTATLSPVSSYVYDTLQTDPIWTLDNTGYNVKVKLPATAFPTGGATYRGELAITDAASDPYWALVRAQALAIKTS